MKKCKHEFGKGCFPLLQQEKNRPLHLARGEVQYFMSISVFLTFLTLSGELGCMDMDADVSQHEKLLTLSGELGCMIWMQTCHCTTYGQKANSEYIHANQQRNNKRYHFEMTKETTSQ